MRWTKEDHRSMVRGVPGVQEGQDKEKIQDLPGAGFPTVMGEQLKKKVWYSKPSRQSSQERT